MTTLKIIQEAEEISVPIIKVGDWLKIGDFIYCIGWSDLGVYALSVSCGVMVYICSTKEFIYKDLCTAFKGINIELIEELEIKVVKIA